jgi:hypothetical protein
MKQHCCFSEAIRDGAKLRLQTFTATFSKGGSCALGAGYEAIAGKRGARTGEVREAVCAEFSYLQKILFNECPNLRCPRGSFNYSHAVDAIVHLNDEHRWTREAIADWLYMEEEKLGFITITEEVERVEEQRVVTV